MSIQENEMEFLKLTSLYDEELLINIAHIVSVNKHNDGAFVIVSRGESHTVRESAEYIAQHVYVCNKSYVNEVKG
ncbi:Flagellar [uncultured Caudovirales phage]|uniref:Flagellar n=1 Tax=uncultured Caudovirales phage TaxID=2100421 RepID=A0A6J7WAX3_9CAUD|nr:Flagellar [uncultured Caudovirales phage]